MKRKSKIQIVGKYQRKQVVIICLLFILSISFTATLGRYAVNKAKYSFTKTKEFYFHSDKLDVNNPTYQIENWSGVDDYIITINMNSYDNNLIAATYDIDYDILYTCSNNAICTISKSSGTIYSNTNTDFFNITITPNTRLSDGDRVSVTVTAKTEEPYESTLTGTFVLIVGEEKLTYEIKDESNRPYLELNITNTLSYYLVETAFGSYSVGDKITADTYLALSEENKAKCYSAKVTLTFDPNVVRLDMTNDNYLNATAVNHITSGGYNYINSITFKIDAISSTTVRFYKQDESQNYTYPIVNNMSIINLTSI